MTILVLAEHDNQQLKADTAKIVNAAVAIGGDIHVFVVGENCAAVADQAKQLAGVKKVRVADASVYGAQLAENVAKLITDISADYSHILAAASSVGKSALPRVAALADVAQISEVVAVVDADTFTHPIYAGNALETVKSLDAIKVLTVRPSAFDAVSNDGNAEVESLTQVFEARTTFVSQTLTESARPELGNAGIIVSGGRGMGSGENFVMLEQLADKLGAAVGASRAAVDAGFVPNDLQVGQTGKIVAPDLYLAVGISGAIQHLAGMKDSKVIVAINKDPEAPIFQVADYGLEADLFEAIPSLNSLI
ncbi:electron transfer flavoprotein subunit alpha/FixB family protein [Shewanella intestini]|uniref:Electron transfer flavoprotein subunit alpha/FixB family protein n=1 Tax=Shewanella intestini TaxID=2017544 RepID=A0ABS5I067_9GAMM|nr:MULTISPECIES: FAD-binding protein [Shewanella]MBR9727411.1 electron transfer flavoprotein subunit alpha/FixB family protein [Shewanella intestini]MRG35539.1 electron transfer flavoprotein subunit alpha/FixB family protein [Shewanella sp. XMDDZSB0408]